MALLRIGDIQFAAQALNVERRIASWNAGIAEGASEGDDVERRIVDVNFAVLEISSLEIVRGAH